MGDSKLSAAALTDLINKLKDIEGNYKSLVEKMSKLQFEVQELGLDSVAGKLGKPVSEAPDNAKLIGDMLHEMEQTKAELNEG